MEETGIEQARKGLGEIVDRARYRDEPTLITRTGKPAAVVIGIETLRQIWGVAVAVTSPVIRDSPIAAIMRRLDEADEEDQ